MFSDARSIETGAEFAVEFDCMYFFETDADKSVNYVLCFIDQNVSTYRPRHLFPPFSSTLPVCLAVVYISRVISHHRLCMLYIRSISVMPSCTTTWTCSAAITSGGIVAVSSIVYHVLYIVERI